MSMTKNEARLSFRLSAASKRIIEDAALTLGQTVSDFAVSTLVQSAQRVIREQRVTTLSQRDSEAFAKLIDDPTLKPNKSLMRAAQRYKKRRVG